MRTSWISQKLNQFARDVLRDYCLASRELSAQFDAYETQGAIDFGVLRNVTGDETHKGLLWRLKDTAHHVFRPDPGFTPDEANLDDPAVARFLDWGLGYIFHETLKLKEDAYQLSQYAPWFEQLNQARLSARDGQMHAELITLLDQTRESISREIARIRFIMAKCREMFPWYYARHRENPLLARFLVHHNGLVREVFQDGYEPLIRGIYGDKRGSMYLMAAVSLREGGWLKEAMKALEEGRMVQDLEPSVLEGMRAEARRLDDEMIEMTR